MDATTPTLKSRNQTKRAIAASARRVHGKSELELLAGQAGAAAHLLKQGPGFGNCHRGPDERANGSAI